MTTIKMHSPVYRTNMRAAAKHRTSIWNELAAFAHGKSVHQEHWLKVLLVTQAILFLPVAALLLVSYQAPLVLTVPAFALFLANIIGCLGGSGMRVVASLFGIAVIDVLMLVMVIL